MGIARSALLWASTNRTLRRMAPRVWFVRRALRRFMPGETLEDGLEAAETFRRLGIPTLFTHLGENVADQYEAIQATEDYLRAIDRVDELGLDTEMSVKLTHLGLDLDPGLAAENYLRLVRRAAERGDTVWIDMESSEYVERTLEVYRTTLEASPNAGLCLQAYLHRTRADLEDLLPLGPSIRLVKGAYREPPELALQRPDEIDEAFLGLSVTLLRHLQEGKVRRYAAGSHDLRLLGRVATASRDLGVSVKDWEIEMLYGIRHAEQLELARRGYPVRTLISYGPAWYPWYVRRLAEKPGENLAYVLRNVFKAAPTASG
ncbi:MAG TPA: proline dehydrogenase family protein [Actinomycetota bacterium]